MSSRKINNPEILIFLDKLQNFQKESHLILSKHESTKSRVIILDDTYKKLISLSLNQDELFKQALRCVENELYRASHVMAWAGFVDFLDEKLASDVFVKLKSVRTNWSFSTVEDLREISTEHNRIEAARLMGLYSKTEMKALHGLLNKRNESAHPSHYYPSLNEALGYISELLQRIEDFQKRTF